MKVVIVGCGWLGQQLGVFLAQHNYIVTGSRRSAEGLALLHKSIRPLLLDLNQPPKDDVELLELLHDAVLICAIPPQHNIAGEHYVAALIQLSLLAKQAQSRAILHFSSVGIYQGLSGLIDEQTPLQLTNNRVNTLFQAEQILQQSGVPCITMRLAGLMGKGRHPARFLAGRPIVNPTAAITMVHADDICRATMCILDQPFTNAMYNLSCPQSVQRQIFYQKAAETAGLTIAETGPELEPSKIVDASAFCQRYGFHYRFPSAVDALMYCN